MMDTTGVSILLFMNGSGNRSEAQRRRSDFSLAQRVPTFSPDHYVVAFQRFELFDPSMAMTDESPLPCRVQDDPVGILHNACDGNPD